LAQDSSETLRGGVHVSMDSPQKTGGPRSSLPSLRVLPAEQSPRQFRARAPVPIAKAASPKKAASPTKSVSPKKAASPKKTATPSKLKNPPAKAKAVQRTITKTGKIGPKIEDDRPKEIQKLDSIFRPVPKRGPPRVMRTAHTPDGSKRSVRLAVGAARVEAQDESGADVHPRYWPAAVAAVSPNSKEAYKARQKGGETYGVGTYTMELSPRAPKFAKKCVTKASKRRMDKWLDDTILNQDENMWTFSKGMFQRMCRKVGALRMGAALETELRYELSDTTRAMVRDILIHADAQGSKTVTTKHVRLMLKSHGLDVWMPGVDE